MAKPPSRSSRRVVVVDPIASVDAQIRETQARIKRLEEVAEADQVRVGDIGYEPGVEGARALALAAELQAKVDDLRHRRVALIAGIDPDPPAPPKAETRAAPRGAWPPSLKLSPADPADADLAKTDAALRAAHDEIAEVCKLYGADRLSGLFFAMVRTVAMAEARASRLAERVARLEALVDEAPLKWCGSHQRALSYRQGSVVTRGGSAWVAICDVPPNTLPGDGTPDFWQLAVKRGADGKDAQ